MRRSPEDFVVDEIPAYEPSGEGEHVYVRVRKRGLNTADVTRTLAQSFGLREQDVGYAGRKDKWAVTTQWMSVYWPGKSEEAELARFDAESGGEVEVLETSRHANKLRRGHLAGNRFELRIRDIAADVDVQSVQAACAALRERGCYNYYGAQRFGYEQRTLADGLAILERWGGGRRRRLKRRDVLALNAVQSAAFNRYIWMREVEGPGVRAVLEGDVLKRVGGGLFVSEEPEVDGPRLVAGEVVLTGPMAGAKMMAAKGASGGFEARVLESVPRVLVEERIRGAEGSRREVLVWPEGLTAEIDTAQRVLTLRFGLPSGSYATVVCRELMGDENELS